MSGSELNLSYIPGAFSDTKDLLGFDPAALGWALRFNAHFTSITAVDIDAKIANMAVAHVLAASQGLSRVSWVGGEGEKQFLGPFSAKHRYQIIQVRQCDTIPSWIRVNDIYF